jgi:uncharacterized protein YigE (DUF2233 family)
VKKASRIVAESFSKLGLALLVILVPEVSIRAESAPCQPVTYEHSEYTVCEVDLRRQSVKLFWKKPDGQPYEYLSSHDRNLVVFAISESEVSFGEFARLFRDKLRVERRRVLRVEVGAFFCTLDR